LAEGFRPDPRGAYSTPQTRYLEQGAEAPAGGKERRERAGEGKLREGRREGEVRREGVL